MCVSSFTLEHTPYKGTVLNYSFEWLLKNLLLSNLFADLARQPG